MKFSSVTPRSPPLRRAIFRDGRVGISSDRGHKRLIICCYAAGIRSRSNMSRGQKTNARYYRLPVVGRRAGTRGLIIVPDVRTINNIQSVLNGISGTTTRLHHCHLIRGGDWASIFAIQRRRSKGTFKLILIIPWYVPMLWLINRLFYGWIFEIEKKNWKKTFLLLWNYAIKHPLAATLGFDKNEGNKMWGIKSKALF